MRVVPTEGGNCVSIVWGNCVSIAWNKQKLAARVACCSQRHFSLSGRLDVHREIRKSRTLEHHGAIKTRLPLRVARVSVSSLSKIP